MEKVVLVKTFQQEKKQEVEADIEELTGLITTAGGVVVDVFTQKKDQLSPSYYIGKGKAEEIAQKHGKSADLVVFDNELKPVQLRNLEKLMEVRVIDRTQLILDIFAQRAHTREGILQVEYAQLNYALPRLTGLGVEMSRLGGGIGTRGPGESKLETDRRKIRKRIQHIKGDIEKIRAGRARQRERRKAVPVPQVALVGYTNVGKTMLLNRLTDAGMLSENKLFATLDPKIKQFTLPSGYKILFSDTVGFIKNLPTHLVAAFRATLEEVKDADVIVHLIDAGSPHREKQKEVVYGILADIGALEGKKVIEVYNKVDTVSEDERKLLRHRAKGIYISAKTGENVDAMVKAVSDAVDSGFELVEALIPMKSAGAAAMFYEEGIVLKREDREDGIYIKARCLPKTFEKYKKIISEVK